MLDRRAALVALASLAVGIGVVLYRGPGVGWIRGHVGDVAIVVFLVASLAAVRIGGPRHRLVGVGLFALGAELLQGLDLVGPDAPLVLHLTLGSTFDPVDLAFYGIGLGIAAAFEWGWTSTPAKRVP